jgi:hypothetical protein
MVALPHHLFDNDCSPSFSKSLKSDLHSSPSTSISVNTYNIQNDSLSDWCKHDIQVEDVYLVEEEEDIVQPARMAKPSLPIMRSKSDV